jgi:virginiamycin B lyase
VILKVHPRELQTTNVDPGEGSVLLGSTGKVTVKGAKQVVAKKQAVRLPMACAKGQDCTGTVDLVTAKKVKVPKGATTAKAKAKARVVIGSASYSIKAGKKKAVKIKLNKAGKKLVKKKPLAVKVTAGGKSAGTLKIRR